MLLILLGYKSIKLSRRTCKNAEKKKLIMSSLKHCLPVSELQSSIIFDGEKISSNLLSFVIFSKKDFPSFEKAAAAQ